MCGIWGGLCGRGGEGQHVCNEHLRWAEGGAMACAHGLGLWYWFVGGRMRERSTGIDRTRSSGGGGGGGLPVDWIGELGVG
jgi:hypothetical protein